MVRLSASYTFRSQAVIPLLCQDMVVWPTSHRFLWFLQGKLTGCSPCLFDATLLSLPPPTPSNPGSPCPVPCPTPLTPQSFPHHPLNTYLQLCPCRLNYKRLDRPTHNLFWQRLLSSGARTADGDKADWWVLDALVWTRGLGWGLMGAVWCAHGALCGLLYSLWWAVLCVHIVCGETHRVRACVVCAVLALRALPVLLPYIGVSILG